MTSTVRSVRVELEASVGSYIAKMRAAGEETDRAFSGMEARAAGAERGISGLDKSTTRLSKSSADARTQQASLGREIEKTGRSSDRSGAAIDKYSGRLKTILALATTLGPAMGRLALGALPAVSAGIAGIGAAAAGIGVTILALHGMGDALDALDKYQLQPTVANLTALRIEQEKLGPAGAQFVSYLNRLSPALETLQQMAGQGLLPGLEQGIDDMITRLPMVQSLVASLSSEMGTLATDAGHALASDEWTPFFTYVQTQAAPILDAFSRSAGNVALGLGNMLVAFDPLTRNFTTGLEDMTARFADWSKHLEDDKGFQSFLATVEQAGPELIDFLHSTGDLFVGLARSAAPLAQTTIPILTGLVQLLASIANSPIGPTIYLAAAAWLAYGRAAAFASKATDKVMGVQVVSQLRSGYTALTTITTAQDRARMSATQMAKAEQEKATALREGAAAAGRSAAAIGFLALSLTGLDDKAGAANASMLGLVATMSGAGPIGITGAVIAGTILDISKANDDLVASTTAAQDALSSGDTDQMRADLDALDQQIKQTDEDAKIHAGTMQGVADAWKVTTGAGLLLGGGINKLGSMWSKLNGDEKDAKSTATDLADALANQNGALAANTPLVGGLVNSLRAGSFAAISFSNALAELNGWLDKRDAVLSYRDAIDQLVQGLKDGFDRSDLQNIQAAARGMLQVANQIKSPAKRAEFLQGARGDLEKIAHDAPAAADAIGKLVDKLDSKGLTHPPPPLKLIADTKPADDAIAKTRRDAHNMAAGKYQANITADDSDFGVKIRRTNMSLTQVDHATATPHVNLNPGNTIPLLGSILGNLGSIDGYHATATITTVHQNVFPSGGGRAIGGNADGGTIPGPRHPYGDKMLTGVAPGEEIISNRYGQADRNRGALKAANAGAKLAVVGYADGGTRTGFTSGNTYANGGPFHAVNDAAHALDGTTKAADGTKKALERLNKQIDKVQNRYEKQTQKLDDLISQRNSIAGGISSAAIHDPFGNGLAGLDTQVSADTNDIDAMAAALGQLVAHGLDPKSALYQQLAASMDVNTAQQLAALSSADLQTRSTQFQHRADEAGHLGMTVANQSGLGAAIEKQTKVTDKLDRTIDRLHDAIKDLHTIPKHVKDAAYDGTWHGARDGSEEGTRRGNDEQRQRTRVINRTGGGR